MSEPPSSLVHQYLTAHCLYQSVQPEDHPNPVNPNLPALLAYKYRSIYTGKSWSSETLRVAAEHPPFVLPPLHRFAVF